MAEDSKSRHLSQPFRWAVGVECSCIPHLSIDQFRWTQHERFWREDFKRVADELGCHWMRYSLPWHLVEPRRGTFDWSWADERIAFAKELGIEFILDLIHFGTPAWLPDAFGDPDFPSAFEAYTKAFARQYQGVIHSVSPLNEPLITSLFCGDIGLWPPHGRSLKSYTVILSRVAQGITRSIRALREFAPAAEIVVCDALEFPRIEATAGDVATPELLQRIQKDLSLRLERRHVVIDLIMGRVGRDHPLYGWLEQHGFSSLDLGWFQRNPVKIDVLGLDYYCHSEMELYPCGENHFRQRVPAQLAGLNKAARDYWHRYRLPMMITETSYYGNDAQRQEWLRFTVEDIRKLRVEGIPIIGYTWWPLLDHLDWDGALLHQIGKIHHVGIYRLQRQPDGILARQPTPLVQEYRALVAQQEQAIGSLAFAAETQEQQELAVAREQTSLPPVPGGAPIIVHCHLRWDGVWQRPQQFISRLSKKHRVLFVEGPVLVSEDVEPRYELVAPAQYPHIHVMRTFFPAARFGESAWVDRQRLCLLQEALAGPLKGQFERPVQWFYDPMAAPCFIGKMESSTIVYDCMDQLAQFKFAPPEISRREEQLLAAADVVFVGGRKLHQAKLRHNANSHFYGCGVEFQHFSKARAAETVVPFDLDFIHRPILGYFGVIDERLDYELITKLADANPDWSVVLVGPLAKVDAEELPNRTNLYWLGRREYSQLPAYSKAFAACLMPFALNEATEFINPTKALEYMAVGKPIISSAVPDVISNFGEVVRVAHSHCEFIEACRLAVASPEGFPIERGFEMARQSEWDVVVARLEGHLRDAVRRKAPGRHSQQESLGLSPGVGA